MASAAPLAGVRVIECSLLGAGALATHLVDLGAEVIKVEPPSGDYVREMTWPIVDGVSLMHLHINRGKRSIVLNLRPRGRRGVQGPRPRCGRGDRGDAAWTAEVWATTP